jgi:hypothetical protein
MLEGIAEVGNKMVVVIGINKISFGLGKDV